MIDDKKARLRQIVGRLVLLCGALVVMGTLVFFASQSQAPGAGNVADQVYEASEESGGIGEKVMGDLEKAKLVVYEYADYGCSHCADWNRIIDELVKNSGGDVAVVFRAYNLGFPNGERVAAGATAAQLQGYWSEYKELLFGNQAEWLYTEEDVADNLLVEYFVKASDGKGDTEKFLADLDSKAVTKRLEFENKMGQKAGVKGTPTFRIDGAKVDLSNVLETIEQKLSE